MGAGSALMEELAVDKSFGTSVKHDLAGHEVTVHADIPHQARRVRAREIPITLDKHLARLPQIA